MIIFAPGTEVEIINGSSKGRRGIVRGMSDRHRWEGQPEVDVELPWPDGVRVMRADYLRAVGKACAQPRRPS